MKRFLRLPASITNTLKNKHVQFILTVLILLGFFFTASFQNVQTETYDIEKFSPAKETIHSPITIENTKETERRIREVVQAVDDQYEISEEVAEEQIVFINEIFEAVNKIENGEVQNEEADSSLTSTEEKIAYLEELVDDNISSEVDTKTFQALFSATEETRMLAKELFTTALLDTYHGGIKVEEKDEAVATMQQRLQYSTLDESFVDSLHSLITFSVKPNSFFSAEQTNIAQQEARNNVEPVMIRAGEILVDEGQFITNEIYEQLEITGLTKEERNIYPTVGLLILVLLIGVFLYFEFLFQKEQHLGYRKLLVIILLSLFLILLLKVVSFYSTATNPLYFLAPVASVSMVLKILLNDRMAIMLSIFFAVIGSVIFNANIPGLLNMEAGIFILFSQLASILFLTKMKDKNSIFISGLATSFVNIAAVCLFLFLSFEKYTWMDYFIFSGYGLVSALLSTILTLGMIPFFETGLGILSDSKLITLSSPNQPLLRKLLTVAPGTYHHSIMVANLSEASCEAIGANGLLARVGAYYHDLGKTLRPHYFIENQMGMKNPHDFLNPSQSAAIILQHPVDGAKMLKREKLPKEIIDIAMQHHGTSLLKYFYHQAKEKNPETKEEDFRYNGPIPNTKEAAIVSICDSVEAAVRAQKEPDQEKIKSIVSAIMEDRLLDGQLNDSHLTLNDLERIKSVICETLNGIYHSRIQYPDKDTMKEAR